MEYAHPNFSKNFLYGLATLTDDYEEGTYRRFLNTFGTHYVRQATMGALFGQQTEITFDSWSHMVSDGIDIGAYANFGAIASVNASLNYNNTASEYWTENTVERRIYSRGAAPPTDGNGQSWMQNTITEPNTLVS